MTILCRNVPVVCGASYHLLGYQISQDSKILFWLHVESYISDWQFSKSRLFSKLCFLPYGHGLWQYSVSWAQKNDLAAFTLSPALHSQMNTCSSLPKWSSWLLLVTTKRLSMYALMYSKAAIRFPISAWKMSANPANPIGSLWYEYLPHGIMIVHILAAVGSNLMV